MRKIAMSVVLAGGLWLWALPGLCPAADAPDDDSGSNTTMSPQNQEDVQDEGYGNSDAEYYNSEDDVINDQEAGGESSAPENSAVPAHY